MLITYLAINSLFLVSFFLCFLLDFPRIYVSSILLEFAVAETECEYCKPVNSLITSLIGLSVYVFALWTILVFASWLGGFSQFNALTLVHNGVAVGYCANGYAYFFYVEVILVLYLFVFLVTFAFCFYVVLVVFFIVFS